MENEDEICGVCSNPYDADKHIPRVLINCGHSICACCLIIILKSPQLRKCPYDNLEFQRPQKCLENFPVNFGLLNLLEGRNRNICKTHREKLIMFCLQDNVKICYDCALLGEHKGHDMKKLSELKAQGMKAKKDLKESWMKFEKNQLEKDRALNLLNERCFRKITKKFAEIKELISEKETEFIKQMDSLFKRSEEKSTRLLLKGEVDKKLEGIDKAYHQGENLALLDQDSSSMISKFEPQDVQQEVINYSNECSKMMDCMELFLTGGAKYIKDFNLSSSEKLVVEDKQKYSGAVKFKTLLTLDFLDTCLYIRAKNQNPVDLVLNFGAQNKVKKISVELDKYFSFFQGSVDFNLLSQILNRSNSYTCLIVSFAPTDLIDYRALSLLNLLFFRIQHLIEIEISFERCEITNRLIIFFSTEILPKAVCLRNLTLKLGSTFISDTSLFALAKSLAPLRPDLEIFRLGAGNTAIADNGIESILNAILGIKELGLDLRGTLVTDKSLRVIGNNIMPSMISLEKFSLNCSDTRITIEGIDAIFTGIPGYLKYLTLDFKKTLSDEVVSLFEEKVCPKLKFIEDVDLRLRRSDLEEKVAKLLESVKQKHRGLRKYRETIVRYFEDLKASY